MSGDNQYIAESNTRLGAAAEQLISDMLALTSTYLLHRAYGDLRMDAVSPSSAPPAPGSSLYVRPIVDLLQDIHLEDPGAVIDGVITSEDASSTTWYSTQMNRSAVCPTAAVSGWDPQVLRLALYRHEYVLPDPVDPDLQGDDGGLDDLVTVASPFSVGEAVLKGDKRLVSIFGVSTTISSNAARTTGSLNLTELMNWKLVSQVSLPAFYSTSNVITGFKILMGGETWKSNQTRNTTGLFDAAEKSRWTKL